MKCQKGEQRNTGRTHFKKGIPSWNKGLKKSGMSGKHQSPEHKAKLSLSHLGEKNWQYNLRGEKSPSWISDRTLLKGDRQKMYDTKYKYWMLSVKERDIWKCKIANKDCDGRLEAHHILSWKEYPELRYQINNGISLCHAHHPRGRVKEKLFQSQFQDLVKNK